MTLPDERLREGHDAREGFKTRNDPKAAQEAERAREQVRRLEYRRRVIQNPARALRSELLRSVLPFTLTGNRGRKRTSVGTIYLGTRRCIFSRISAEVRVPPDTKTTMPSANAFVIGQATAATESTAQTSRRCASTSSSSTRLPEHLHLIVGASQVVECSIGHRR